MYPIAGWTTILKFRLVASTRDQACRRAQVVETAHLQWSYDSRHIRCGIGWHGYLRIFRHATQNQASTHGACDDPAHHWLGGSCRVADSCVESKHRNGPGRLHRLLRHDVWRLYDERRRRKCDDVHRQRAHVRSAVLSGTARVQHQRRSERAVGGGVRNRGRSGGDRARDRFTVQRISQHGRIVELDGAGV